MNDNNIQVNSVNLEKLKTGNISSNISKKNLGKGKVLLAIDKVLIGAAAIFEFLRTLPGFGYLKAIEIGRLTTWFNTTIGKMTAEDPNSVESVLKAIDATKDGIGMVFSSILEFVLQHPTVTVLGVTTCVGLLAIPFKLLIRKLRENKLEKEEQSLKKKR